MTTAINKKSTIKKFVFLWLISCVGFIGTRYFQELPLDTYNLIGGAVTQFIIISIIMGSWSIFQYSRKIKKPKFISR